MPYRLDIPGQVSEFQLRAIEAVASLVPEYGCVVEVGSLFGLSSWAWAKSVPDSATVHCIDPWEGNEGSRGLEEAYGVKYGEEQFKEYTKDCTNIVPIKQYSPDGIKDWPYLVDLYYEDAVHNNPILEKNIDFWTSKLTPNGIVCGDDYRPRFPDVRAAAEAQAKRLGRKLWIVDFFWCVLPDPATMPAAKVVGETLARLADEAKRAHLATSTSISIDAVVPPPSAVREQIDCIIRVVNDGALVWPTHAEDELQLACEVVANDGTVIVRKIHGLGVRQLPFDTPIDLSIKLPLDNATSQEVTLRASLLPSSDDKHHPTPWERSLLVETSGRQPLTIGAIAKLGQGGGFDHLVGQGWSAAEPSHRWSTGIIAELALTLPENAPDQGWLDLKLRPFVAGGVTSQRLTLLANDTEVFSGRLSGLASLSIPITLDAVGRSLLIRMIQPDACRPSDIIAGNEDHRTLGFAVEALAITNQSLLI